MKNVTLLFSTLIIVIISACASSEVYTFKNEKGETILSAYGQQTLLPKECSDRHTISLLNKEIKATRKEAKRSQKNEKEIKQEVNRTVNDFFATKGNYKEHSEYLANKNAEQIISRKITVNDFKEIYSDFPVDIYYTQRDTPSVELKGIAYMLNRLEVSTKKGVLNLNLVDKCRNGCVLASIECYITSPILTQISGSGICSFNAKETTQFKDFTFSGRGVNNINFSDLYCENFTFKNSGDCNSTFHIKKADKVLISTSGAGQIELKVNCRELSFQNRGTDNINATVNCQTLQATNSGVGKITLSGFADDVKIKNSGMNNIDISKLNK